MKKEVIKDWNFDEFEITTERFTNWDMYEKLEDYTDANSKVLDLGCGGGEKILKFYPTYLKEVLGTDLSKEMIATAKKNLKDSERKNISFRLMDNLKMDVPKDYFDVVVARHTVIDPKQIYDVLKPNGHLIIRGVDKYDCHSLKKTFGHGLAYDDSKPISIIDYENVLDAGFKDVELVSIHELEYYKNRDVLKSFLLKVPILDDVSEEKPEGFSDYYQSGLDDAKLDEYVENNTCEKGIRLIRRYYGITAKK